MLFVVATPIGNLGDITIRAIETLKTVDLIAAEDTRRTRILLNHLQIKTKITSYHDHSKAAKSEALIRLMKSGQRIALVTDAGTPSISDPGFYLVRECRAAGITVVPIPGPAAIITAICAAGFPTDKFMFVGFLPKKPGKRQSLLESFRMFDGTVACYESPYRIEKTLTALSKSLPDWQICIARELTKKFEAFHYGRADELIKDARLFRGEIVLLLHSRGMAL